MICAKCSQELTEAIDGAFVGLNGSAYCDPGRFMVHSRPIKSNWQEMPPVQQIIHHIQHLKNLKGFEAIDIIEAVIKRIRA